MRSLFVLLFIAMSNAFAIPQLINYQGNLTDTGGAPLDTVVTMTFTIHGDAVINDPAWTETLPSISVVDGFFAVTLGTLVSLTDGVFNNPTLWLGISIGSDPEMTPRQRVVSTPYSYRVGTVDEASGGSITSEVVINSKINVGSDNTNAGDYANVLGTSNIASGHYTLVGGGVANAAIANFSAVGGGAFNSANAEYAFIGGGRDGSANGDYSTISGGQNNATAVGAPWATVSGGADNSASNDYAAIAGGLGNVAGGSYTALSGGNANSASGTYSTIGGGQNNSTSGAGDWATISGGLSNDANADYTAIAGGRDNIASGEYAFVGSGNANTASGLLSVVCGGGVDSMNRFNYAMGDYSFVGGGTGDSASGDYSVVAGGTLNAAGGDGSTVGGGGHNQATAIWSTVPGGLQCQANGLASYAAGYFARADATGSFVWADASTTTPFSGGTSNRVYFRATNGYRLYTNSAVSLGVGLNANDTSWNVLSDSTRKNNIREIDCQDALKKISDMRITRWCYKDGDPNLNHIGPMAQDFWNAFHVGSDSLSISTVDADGVLFAAVQELAKQNEKQQNEIRELRTLVQTLLADKQQSGLIIQQGE